MNVWDVFGKIPHSSFQAHGMVSEYTTGGVSKRILGKFSAEKNFLEKMLKEFLKSLLKESLDTFIKDFLTFGEIL